MVRKVDWGHGKRSNLFVFDNTANGCLDSPVLNPKQSGELRVMIDFGANPGENLTVLLYAEFENLLEVNEKSGHLRRVSMREEKWRK